MIRAHIPPIDVCLIDIACCFTVSDAAAVDEVVLSGVTASAQQLIVHGPLALLNLLLRINRTHSIQVHALAAPAPEGRGRQASGAVDPCTI